MDRPKHYSKFGITTIVWRYYHRGRKQKKEFSCLKIDDFFFYKTRLILILENKQQDKTIDTKQ